MTLQIPWALQKVNGGDPDIEYPARLVRSATTSQLYSEGILGSTSFLAHERGAGANFTVEVDAGTAVIDGDDEADQGSYVVQSTGVESVTVDAAPGSDSRLDLVYLMVADEQAGGATGSEFTVEYLAGTPAGSPTLPTVPDSCIAVAQIGPVVPSTPSITDSLITDLRGAANLAHPVVSASAMQADSISTAAIQDDAVTTAKVDDGAVTLAKLEASVGAFTAYVPTIRLGTYVMGIVDDGGSGYFRFGDFIIMKFSLRTTENKTSGDLNVSLPVDAADSREIQGFSTGDSTGFCNLHWHYAKDDVDRIYFLNLDQQIDEFPDTLSDDSTLRGVVFYQAA